MKSIENIVAIISAALPDMREYYKTTFSGRYLRHAYYSKDHKVHVTVDSPANDVIQIDLDGGTLPEGLKHTLMNLSPDARYDSYWEDETINRIIRIPDITL
jgi:hypothetical protein